MSTALYRFTWLIAFLLVTSLINAQSNYRPGFIITLQQDTVYGEIDYRTDKMNADRCVFRPQGDNNADATIYRPFDIQGYRFTEDGRYYISKTVSLKNDEQQPVFLEYLLKGIKSLYYLETGDNLPVYFIEEGNKLVKVDAPRLAKQSVNYQFQGQKDRYVPVLHYVFGDCPELSSRIDKMRFRRADIVNLTKEYHYAMCTSNEECIEFEAKEDKKKVQLHFTAYGGVMQYIMPFRSESACSRPDMSYLVGAGMSISSVRWMSSLSACIDFSLSHLATVESARYKNSGTMLSGKLGIRYTYPKRMIRPFAEFGLDISKLISGKSEYNGKSEDWQDGVLPGYYVNAGVEIKLSRKSNHHWLHVRAQFKDNRDMIEKSRFVSGWSGVIGYTF